VKGLEARGEINIKDMENGKIVITYIGE